MKAHTCISCSVTPTTHFSCPTCGQDMWPDLCRNMPPHSPYIHNTAFCPRANLISYTFTVSFFPSYFCFQVIWFLNELLCHLMNEILYNQCVVLLSLLWFLFYSYYYVILLFSIHAIEVHVQHWLSEWGIQFKIYIYSHVGYEK